MGIATVMAVLTLVSNSKNAQLDAEADAAKRASILSTAILHTSESGQANALRFDIATFVAKDGQPREEFKSGAKVMRFVEELLNRADYYFFAPND